MVITKACSRSWKPLLRKNGTAMLWQIDIHPADGQPDRAAESVRQAAREMHFPTELKVATSRGYLVQGKTLDHNTVEKLAAGLLVDPIVERAEITQLDGASSKQARNGKDDGLVTVLLKPG